ncbi:MAG: type II secretion system minor pseudopilin GspK [Candidatus Omnitrophota bacterium]
MKFHPLKSRNKNDSGIILLIVLWFLAILSLLAVSLGRRTSVDLKLAGYSVGKFKSDQTAWAGFIYALDLIKKDSEDKEANSFDTRYQCAVKFDTNEAPEGIFKDVELGQGHFDISYADRDDNGVRQVRFGFRDEESKINLNGVTAQNMAVLAQLIVLLDFNEDEAGNIAAAVADWIDGDSTLAGVSMGAEDGDYAGLTKPYHCKNLPFDSVEELLLVKGMTPQIFAKIRSYVTIFPKEGPLAVNINTASKTVLRALARSSAGPVTNTQLSDADSLVEKIIEYRHGEDKEEFSADDRNVDMNEAGFTGLLNGKERAIFQTIRPNLVNSARCIRLGIKAVDSSSEVESWIEAVILRDDLSVVFWKRN